MPTVRCGDSITAARLVVSGVGYGTLANAKKNAYRDALNPLLPFMGRERSRWRCERRCPGIVEWRQRVRYGAAVPRPNNTVRITCRLTLRLVVECSGGSLAMVHQQYLGPFASAEFANESQLAAILPLGGGKSGVFFLDDIAASLLARGSGHYYIAYMPGSPAEADAAPFAGVETTVVLDAGEVPVEGVESPLVVGVEDDIISAADLTFDEEV